jgi:hypothetical protein
MGCAVNVTRQMQIVSIAAIEICFAIFSFLRMYSLVKMCRTITVRSSPDGSRHA